MDLQIENRNIPHSDALHDHARVRLAMALDRVLTSVRRVAVRMLDLNGPRGGVDKRCEVCVELATGETVRVRETQACLYVAVDRCAGRIKRVVKERLSRRQSSRRPRGPRH